MPRMGWFRHAIETTAAGKPFFAGPTLAKLDARGLLKHKRLYWVIESRLHHPLGLSLDEARSRVRPPQRGDSVV